jgi:hypothetical protein
MAFFAVRTAKDCADPDDRGRLGCLGIMTHGWCQTLVTDQGGPCGHLGRLGNRGDRHRRV